MGHFLRVGFLRGASPQHSARSAIAGGVGPASAAKDEPLGHRSNADTTVECAPGKGRRFRVRLPGASRDQPALEVRPASTPLPPPESDVPSGVAPKVPLIDDSGAWRERARYSGVLSTLGTAF
jgi:hypothetical protein